MEIKRRSILSNTESGMDIPMTPEDFAVCEANWARGMLIQDAFPMLDADQREFIKTGITAAEWDNLSD